MGSQVHAQNKKELKKQAKEAQELQDAIKRRLTTDAAYAESKRPAFNRSSWVGHSLKDLIASWGAPSRVVTDGGNGQIALYENTSTNSGGSYKPGYTVYNGFGQVVGGEASVDTRWQSQYDERVSFFADEKGIITEVKFENNYRSH
ncbi:hypothetical protein DCM91_00530 [Chitinophaga costaii]|nr:hypothetical protein DCM91_00530 [Chitinophaga costaii]